MVYDIIARNTGLLLILPNESHQNSISSTAFTAVLPHDSQYVRYLQSNSRLSLPTSYHTYTHESQPTTPRARVTQTGKTPQ